MSSENGPPQPWNGVDVPPGRMEIGRLQICRITVCSAPMSIVRSSGAAPPMRTFRRPTFLVCNGVGSGPPEETKKRRLTTPRERLVEVGARIVRRGRSIMWL